MKLGLNRMSGLSSFRKSRHRGLVEWWIHRGRAGTRAQAVDNESHNR